VLSPAPELNAHKGAKAIMPKAMGIVQMSCLVFIGLRIYIEDAGTGGMVAWKDENCCGLKHGKQIPKV
jgi:hypothetical protein